MEPLLCKGRLEMGKDVDDDKEEWSNCEVMVDAEQEPCDDLLAIPPTHKISSQVVVKMSSPSIVSYALKLE